jgi:hypothetical protein
MIDSLIVVRHSTFVTQSVCVTLSVEFREDGGPQGEDQGDGEAKG